MKDTITIAACSLAVVAFAALSYGRARADGDVPAKAAAELVHPWSLSMRNGSVERLIIEANGNLVIPSINTDERHQVFQEPVLMALQVNGTYAITTGDARCDESLRRAMVNQPPHTWVVCMRNDELAKLVNPPVDSKP